MRADKHPVVMIIRIFLVKHNMDLNRIPTCTRREILARKFTLSSRIWIFWRKTFLYIPHIVSDVTIFYWHALTTAYKRETPNKNAYQYCVAPLEFACTCILLLCAQRFINEKYLIHSLEIFLGSKHTSSQICWRKIFPLLMGGGGGDGAKNKVAQNDTKHILVLEFWRSAYGHCGE